jgi:ADP-Ribosyltransferase in polyvalent proteins
LVISGNPRDWGGTHTNTPYPFRSSDVPLKTELNNGYTVSITAPDRTIPGATLTLDLNKLGPGQAYVGKLVSTEPSLAPKIIGRAVQLADAKGQTSVTFHANDARLRTLYERRYGATYLGTENVYGMELYKFKFDLTDPAIRQKYGLPEVASPEASIPVGGQPRADVVTDPAVRQQNFDAWFGRGQPQPQEGFIRPDAQRYRTNDGTTVSSELRELLALEGPQPYANASLQGSPSEFVVDGAQPRVAYHGTDKVFYAFERSQTHDSGWLGTGYYFTSDPVQAATYARSRSQSPKTPLAERGEPVVMDVHLSLRKPYVISNNQYFSGKLQGSRALSAEFGQVLRQQGFDGVVFKNGDRIEYCIFNAPQIKSIQNNRGTYSPTDPDIRSNLPVKGAQYG